VFGGRVAEEGEEESMHPCAAIPMFLLVIQGAPQESREDIAPASDLPRPRTITGTEVEAPKKTKDVRPAWPDNALKAGLQGVVISECLIGPDGRIKTVKTLRGRKALALAATEAIQRWEYKPTTLNGVPVPVIMTVTTKFKLGKPPRLEDLLGSMKDPDEEIRASAVLWLGTLRPIRDRQRKAVDAARQDPSALVQEAVRASLEELGKP
jgi:TonB family protein